MNPLAYMDRAYGTIREKIRAAEEKANRSVLMVAAVKYTDAAHINYLHRQLGVCDVGENRVQQLLEHWDALEDRGGLRFHFIGKLQTNKVKYIADKVAMIHSLDSLRLAEEIERQAAKHGRVIDVLVEINSGNEENKSGVRREEAEALCLALQALPHVNLRGFMTMAPKCEKNEDYRKYFRETFDLGIDIWEKKLHNIGRPVFSMGMSGNFEIAIEEGADIVRIGRALFAEPSAEEG
ncbi:MAG: YggS family pyridoxal phosphate-dependent enzyme [Ruminococcaceae bacterium]|nr:YggS family pyridoxal phosphate-dependent enzyme [Oscillospiraceae bacterium]